MQIFVKYWFSYSGSKIGELIDCHYIQYDRWITMTSNTLGK